MKTPFFDRFFSKIVDDFESELDAAGDPAGDRRTKEWEIALAREQFERGYDTGERQGYAQGYQDGRADGQESQRFGNPVSTRNKYPNG